MTLPAIRRHPSTRPFSAGRSFAHKLAIAAAVALAAPTFLASSAAAQDEQGQDEQAQDNQGQDNQAQADQAQADQGGNAPAGNNQADAEPSEELVDLVDDFYYSANVTSFDAANAYGKQIVDGNYNPQALLEAFRIVNEDRSQRSADELARKLFVWQNSDEIGDVTKQIVDQLNNGRVAKATDPAFIQLQIERLANGNTAYQNGLANLRNSGEFALPQMIRVLGNGDQRDLQGDVRRAIIDLGISSVNPLLAATKTSDEQLLTQVIILLGDLQYPEAVPYILEQRETTSNNSVRSAADRALGRLGYAGGSNAAQEYAKLAENFWLRRSSVTPDTRFDGASMWKWSDQAQGLLRTKVPAEIFDELMAMRAAGNGLRLGGDADTQDMALSLWLASNYRRELELPAGMMDPTTDENTPTAEYYGAQAGVPYLQKVLQRVAGERNLPSEQRYDNGGVALSAIQSLQTVIGESNLDAGDTPLTGAMSFPDRRVRIEAAMALAQALPTADFTGKETVVPLLAEAMAETGEPTVMVVMENGDQLNAVAEGLRGAGFRVLGARNAVEVGEQARTLAGIEVVVIDSDMGDDVVTQIRSDSAGNPRLSGAAKLIIAPSTETRFTDAGDPTLATTTARDGEALAQAIRDARDQVGGLPINEDNAAGLAERAGVLLKEIGLGSSVFSLEPSERALLSTLDDNRPGIQMLGGEVVAMIESSSAQQALVDSAVSEENATEVRISLFDSLAESAKRIGNTLESGEVERVLGVASNDPDVGVRTAAAHAVGALSLPADQAKRLIVERTEGEASDN